jgi:hypothetical protein
MQAPPSNLDTLNQNLLDVTKVMSKTMEDVLWRGDSLDREWSRPKLSRARLTYRHVGPVDNAALRVVKVP